MRDLVALQCEECKRKNYTTTRQQEADDGEAGNEEVLPGLPRASLAQGGEGLTGRSSSREVSGSVARIG